MNHRLLEIRPVRDGLPVIVCHNCGRTIFNAEDQGEFTAEELIETTCDCKDEAESGDPNGGNRETG